MAILNGLLYYLKCGSSVWLKNENERLMLKTWCWHSQVTSLYLVSADAPLSHVQVSSPAQLMSGLQLQFSMFSVSALSPSPVTTLLLLLLRCTCETDLCSSFCAYLTWNACPTSSLLYHVYKTKAFVIDLVLKIGLQPFTVYVKKCSAGEQTAYLYSNLKALRFVWVTSVSRAQLSFTTTSLNMIHTIYFIFHLEVNHFLSQVPHCIQIWLIFQKWNIKTINFLFIIWLSQQLIKI